MKECRNCKYARKAENPEYVGCVAAARYEDMDYFFYYGRKQIFTGWVNLRCYPDGEGEINMITNGIPCFQPDDYCSHFECRGD